MGCSAPTISTASLGQPDLLLRLAQRGGAEVGLALVVASARERDLARVPAQIVVALGEHRVQPAALEIQRHQHGGVGARPGPRAPSASSGVEQHAPEILVEVIVARRHPLTILAVSCGL